MSVFSDRVLQIKIVFYICIFFIGVSNGFSQVQVQEQELSNEGEPVYVVVVPDVKENATVTAIVAQILRESITRKSKESIAKKDFVHAPDEDYINELIPSYKIHSLEEVNDVIGLQKTYFLESAIRHKLLIIPSLRRDNSPQQEGNGSSENRYTMTIRLYGGYDIPIRTYEIKVDENTIKTIDVSSSENLKKSIEDSVEEETSQNTSVIEKRRTFMGELDNIAYQINDIGSRIRYAVLNINPKGRTSNPRFIFKSTQPVYTVVSRDRKWVLFLNEVEHVSIYQDIEGNDVYLGEFSIRNLDEEYTVYISFYEETVSFDEIDKKWTEDSGPFVGESPISIEIMSGYQIPLYASVEQVMDNGLMLSMRGNYDFNHIYTSLFATFSSNDFISTQASSFSSTTLAFSSGYHLDFSSNWVWSIGLGGGGSLLSHSNISDSINTNNSTFIPVGLAETRIEFNGKIKSTSFYKVFLGFDVFSLFHTVEKVSYSVDQITGLATVDHTPALNTEVLLRLHIGGGIRF